MPASLPQPPLRTVIRGVAVGLLCVALGGCLSRNAADTTGSLGSPALSETPDQLRSASDDLGKRFEADKSDAKTGIAYSRVLRALGQNAQAVAVLQQTAIRNPNDLPVLAAYGKALADGGHFREAAEVLSRAHKPDRPDWRILNVQGAVADQLGDFDQAQRFYLAALAIVPGEPSVLSNQGLSYALAKRLGEAEALLRQADASPRSDARVRQNLALVLGLEGKLGEAEAVLKRDMPPAEAAKSLASIRKMVSQPNAWKALRQTPAADAGAPARG